MRHESSLKKDPSFLSYGYEHVCKCLVCGELFGAKRPKVRYCSNACSQSAYRKRKKQAGHATKKPISAVCSQCGDSFLAKSRKARFCGSSCKQAAYRKRANERKRYHKHR